MAYNGAGVYSLPAGYEAVDNTKIQPSQHNTPLEDLADAQNAARPVVAGGTGATTEDAARVALGFGTGGPAFSCYNTTGQAFSVSTWTRLTFDTEVFDAGGNFASNVFTAPTAGVYLFGGGWVPDVVSSSDSRVALSVNGASPDAYLQRRLDADALGSLDTTLHITAVFSLSASDTVELQAYRQGGDLSAASGNHTHFWGVRLG